MGLEGYRNAQTALSLLPGGNGSDSDRLNYTTHDLGRLLDSLVPSPSGLATVALLAPLTDATSHQDVTLSTEVPLKRTETVYQPSAKSTNLCNGTQSECKVPAGPYVTQKPSPTSQTPVSHQDATLSITKLSPETTSKARQAVTKVSSPSNIPRLNPESPAFLPTTMFGNPLNRIPPPPVLPHPITAPSQNLRRQMFIRHQKISQSRRLSP
jgi:hypothetical protein